jgi:plastocyanin
MARVVRIGSPRISEGYGEGSMDMNAKQRLYTRSKLLLLSYILALSCAPMHAQKKSRYACDEADQATLCSAANTCGSVSSTCTVDVRRSANSANVKPGIPNAKNNQLFCVKAGTTVVWMSSNKNNGFMVSFGTDSPFDPDGPIVGGAKKPITTKASTPGCYKYDVGAFRSGTVYGMSGGGRPEVIILP